MGIDDGNIREEARRRFRSSPALKELREKRIRGSFDNYTRLFSKKRALSSQPGSTLSSLLLWLGLGALCFALIAWVNSPKVVAEGSRIELVIPVAHDGHFYVDGLLNGKKIRFMVDTGATYVSISQDIATQLGLVGGKPTRFETANGSVIGHVFGNQTLNVSDMAMPGLSIGVMDNVRESALLGQNFLRHVEMTQSNDRLVIRGQKSRQQSPSSVSSAKLSAYAGLALLFCAWLSSFVFRRSR